MDFLKRNFIMSLVASTVLTLVIFIIDLLNGAGMDIVNAKTYVTIFLGTLGACSIVYMTYYLITEGSIFSSGSEDAENCYNINASYFFCPYENGFAMVEKALPVAKKKVVVTFSFVDENGNYITDEWFDAASDFSEFGTAEVFKNDRFYIINKKGERISDYFDAIEPTTNRYAKVSNNDSNLVNFVDIKTGKLLWNNWKEEL